MAENALAGLNFLRDNEIDLVLLDIKMPDMNGIEALERILALNKQIPVTIHSAYRDFKENRLTSKATDYILKSANLDPLKKSVKECLSKS